MLVLTRKEGESLIVYDATSGEELGEITLLAGGQHCRIGVTGDRLRVVRREISGQSADSGCEGR